LRWLPLISAGASAKRAAAEVAASAGAFAFALISLLSIFAAGRLHRCKHCGFDAPRFNRAA
jgi:hypothetical protein